MDITQKLHGAAPVIRVCGDLDRLGAPGLEKALRAHVKAGNHRLVLDLSDCSYIDSGGLATIMTTAGDLRDDGLLVIVAPSLSIRRLLEVVGLYDHRRCSIFKTLHEALSVAAPAPQETAS